MQSVETKKFRHLEKEQLLTEIASSALLLDYFIIVGHGYTQDPIHVGRYIVM